MTTKPVTLKQVTPEQRKEAKIKQLKWLREQYYAMEKGKDVTPEEKIHLAMHAMELQIRQDRLQRRAG